MKAFNVYIPAYDWVVRVYIGASPVYADEIVSLLKSLGCVRKDLREAENTLYNNRCNEGITFSNNRERMSVMIIEATSSPDEFLNSLVHECGHLATHISVNEGIDLGGEEPQYIAGNFAATIYPQCKHLLCCDCSHKKS